MAKVDDINTQAAVRKFLERQTVVDREDPSSDSSDEVRAILEACALSFLLTPQAALAMILLAKNVLQQVVTVDIEILDYLLKAIDDVDNPNELLDDTSDLIEAQTALIEVDRIGRVGSEVKAFDRYNAAVNRFLDRHLARSLKRRRKNEFERSGTEAKQDLFQVLGAHNPVHEVVASRLELLANAVEDFESVDLTRIVAGKTVSRVRASIKKVLAGIDARTLSKTSTAVELLAGAAALRSISKNKSIYDPVLETGVAPDEREIYASSEVVAARSVGTPTDLTSYGGLFAFDLAVDGLSSINVKFPATGVYGKPFVLSAGGQATRQPTAQNRTLYVELAGATPLPDTAVLVKTVVLATTSQTIAALATAIDTALGSDAGCVAVGQRLVIYGKSPATQVVIRSLVPGTFDIDGNYVPADGSVHEILGFAADQQGETYLLSAATYAALLDEQVPTIDAFVEDGLVVVETISQTPSSSLLFVGAFAVELGFDDAVAEPTYLVLSEDGVELEPTSLGLLPGSVVTVADQVDTTRSLRAPILSIDGNHLLFEPTALPRCVLAEVTAISPLVDAVQSLLDGIRPFVGIYGNDARNLQRALSPLLSRPTLAQVNDAKDVIQVIRAKMIGLKAELEEVVVRADRNEFTALTNNIFLSLEERGLDRASDLLKAASFSEFFSLTSTVASKASRFLKAIEEVGREDFPVSAGEDTSDNVRPRGSTPDQNILNDQEFPEPLRDVD